MGGVLGVAFLISIAIIVFLLKRRDTRNVAYTPEDLTNRTEPKEPDTIATDVDVGSRLMEIQSNDAEAGGRLRYPDDITLPSGRLRDQ